MQRHRDCRCGFVAFEYPRDRDREQGFHAPKRGEAKENSDRRAQSYGMRRVRNRHQGHVMRSQPRF